ncbi:MAG: M64 family metallopeptidase [Pseudohongiellaceae bacterium]
MKYYFGMAYLTKKPITSFLKVLRATTLLLLCSVNVILITGSNIAFAIEQTRVLSLDLSEHDYDYRSETLSVLLTNKGELVWQGQLTSSRQVRGEVFDPISGSIISNTSVETPIDARDFSLRVPAQLEFDRLEVVAETDIGEIRSLKIESGNAEEISALLNQNPYNEDSAKAISASTITTILNNGPSSNRVDIVLLGDGYIESEMPQWEIDAEAAVASFLSEEPYRSYAQYFNAHRVDTISSESGASHPDRNITRDTAFGAYYYCGEVPRLICANDSAINSVVQSLTEPNQSEIVLLLVNDEEYGGSGGSYAIASKHRSSAELILHETGHSFGLLTDEYDDPIPSTTSRCGEFTQTNEPNVSRFIYFIGLKWRHWIPQPVTVYPTPYTLDVSDPGFYKGSKYCNELYRPTPNSLMRSLFRPFDAINEEALVHRIYDFVTPVDSVSPATASVSTFMGLSSRFEVNTQRPSFHELQTTWFVNDQAIESGQSFDSKLLPLGKQTVKVEVKDTTSKVRLDPNSDLVYSHTWEVSNVARPADQAYLQENTLFLPLLRNQEDSSLYQVELEITSTAPYQFTLRSAQLLNGTGETAESATFNAGSLAINNLIVNGVSYSVVLQLDPNMPATVFALVSATVN